MSRRQLTIAVMAASIVAAGALGASLIRTELLRHEFQSQFFERARYPGAALLGRWERFGRVVEAAARTRRNARCDFAAAAVYGTDDEYEQVEAYYQSRTISIEGEAPIAFDVEPVAESELEPNTAPKTQADAAQRDLLRGAGADLRRAATFQTVYTVQAVSWGHSAWLDWRCR